MLFLARCPFSARPIRRGDFALELRHSTCTRQPLTSMSSRMLSLIGKIREPWETVKRTSTPVFTLMHEFVRHHASYQNFHHGFVRWDDDSCEPDFSPPTVPAWRV
jgi:hypothetical protein